jgi:hypothetical protein
MSARPTKQPKPGDLVVLHWLDIVEDAGWQSSAAPKAELAACYSVGWVTQWDRDAVVLVRTFGLEGVAGDKISFPRGCVTRWTILPK